MKFIKGLHINTTYFYRHRYIIGYVSLAVIFSLILLFVSLNLPGGLTNAEMQSTATSDSLIFSSPGTFAISNLPYHIFQRISIDLFGVSVFSIKLPSLIFALLTVIGLILLLRSWFKPNLAILATIIVITTGQFLFIAQSGTPDIMPLLWSVWILTLTITIVKSPDLKRRTIFKSILMVVIALSLYTPVSVYVIVALMLAIATHPHLRHLVRKLNRRAILIATGFGFIILIPLLASLVYRPSLILTLLGAPPSMPNIGDNLAFLLNHYLSFVNANDISAAFITFNIAAMVFIAIGIIQLIKTRETAKSYIIAAWGILLLIPIVIYPSNTNSLFIPLSLLMTMGLASVLGYWYKLFPLNPYARVAGLIPIIILISSVMLAGFENYIYGYSYNPAITSYFSRDLKLLPKDTTTLLVSDDQLPFFQTVARRTDGLTATNTLPETNFTATLDGKPQTPAGFKITRIITDSNYRASDRFYVFSKIDDK